MPRELYHAAVRTANDGTMIKADATNPITVYNENHMVVVGDYDPVLRDYLKRDFSIGLKVNSVRASGYPHTWNEQKRMPSNTTAIDPRFGFGSAENGPNYRKETLDSNYDRDNWSTAFCRCYTTGIRYDFFSREMQNNYGTFGDLTAKDYNDMFVDFAKVTANDFWNGTTPLNSTSGSTWTYQGVISQIGAGNTSAIAAGTKIADALVTKITNLMARLDYAGYPDVIAMNPATYDILIKEEQERQLYSRPIDVEIVPGVSVPGFYTPVGILPVLLTPFIKPETGEGSKTTHKIVALNSKAIDRIWMFNDGPRIYEIATPEQPLSNPSLLTDKFILDFANYIVHGVSTGQHFILTKEV